MKLLFLGPETIFKITFLTQSAQQIKEEKVDRFFSLREFCFNSCTNWTKVRF